MEVRENAAVIRIPVSDPSTAREGLLKFALPRECLGGGCASEPEFYPQDSTEITQDALAPNPPATAPSVPQNTLADLDVLLTAVATTRGDIAAVASDVDYTEFNIRRAGSDLRRSDYPLAQAELDNGRVDSSHEGQQLDFVLWGAHNSLRDTGRSATGSMGDGARVGKDLADALERIDALNAALSADPTRYGEVIPVLGEARGHLQASAVASGSVGSRLQQSAKWIDDAENTLHFADPFVLDIAHDRPGLDVSASAKSLRQAVKTAQDRLADAGDQVTWGKLDLQTASSALDEAENALRQARTGLAG